MGEAHLRSAGHFEGPAWEERRLSPTQSVIRMNGAFVDSVEYARFVRLVAVCIVRARAFGTATAERSLSGLPLCEPFQFLPVYPWGRWRCHVLAGRFKVST